MQSRALFALMALMLIVSTLMVGSNGGALPVAAARPAAIAPETDNTVGSSIRLERIGRYNPGPYRSSDPRAAEIVAFDPVSDRMFIVNSFASSVDIVSISNPAAPVLVSTITISPTYGAAANSVAVSNGLVAVATEATPKTNPGSVVFFDANGTFLNQVTVGALPDMVTFTPDGLRVLTANEGEPSSYLIGPSGDPEGSISVIELPPGQITTTSTLTVTNATFTHFNSQSSVLRTAGVRIFGPNATVAQDLEPEYIAVSPDSSTAYVTLQENNALAIVDISTISVTAVLPLGFKNHNLPGNGMDASDRDGPSNTGRINIRNWPVFGMYQPDGIAAYEASGQVYLVTANEGDARTDWPGLNEEVRAGSTTAYTLETTIFTDSVNLKTNAQLGRLNVTNVTGDTDNDGDFDAIYAFGARSFTIWNAATGAVVFDSGDDLEVRTAAAFPNNFNADSTNGNLDDRSDNKGPEPEAIELATLGGRTYAFVGLERVGGVMIYDVTNPATPTFVDYTAGRSFPGTYATGTPDDLGPEGLSFVPASDSPNGQPLLLVANEVSGSVTVYQIISTSPDGAGSLTLLHNNDGESALLPQTNTVSGQNLSVGGVSAFKAVTEREITNATNLRNAILNVYAGDSFLASSVLACSLPPTATTTVFDAVAQTQLPYTVHILGNHEFDYTPTFLKRFIDTFGGNQPFLSANLGFSAQPGFAGLLDADGLIEQAPAGGRVIGRSMIYTDTVTGQRFGIVGATTPLLPTISSPDQVTVTVDIPATAAAVQAEINRLQSRGVTKIILVSHMQSLTQDRELIALLNGVDIAVAGGGDDLLTNPAITNTLELLPGDSVPSGAPTYPLTQTDATSRTVYIVTTAGNYRYLGRLDVDFNASGEVNRIVAERSYPRRVVPTSTAATTLNVLDAVPVNPALESSVITPVNNCLTTFTNTAVANSQISLDVSRNAVRSRESNAGNLIADSFLFVYDKYAATNSLPARSTANPVIAIQNGGGIRQTAGNTLPISPSITLSRRNTLDVLPFANFVSVVNDVTPAELKLILERSAASLPGEGGQFLQIAGLRVTYNISNTAHVVSSSGFISVTGSRVVFAALEDGRVLINNGQPVAGAPNLRIVTNSFTAEGGDNYPTLANKTSRLNLLSPSGLLSYEDALLEYLASFPKINNIPTIPSTDARYRAGGEGRIQFALTRNVTTAAGTFTNGNASVELPANVFGAVTGTLTIAPLYAPIVVLPGLTPTLAVDIDFANSTGAPITQTAQLYTITLTYSETQLAAAGINELTLKVLFFNEASGTWVEPTAYPPCRLPGCRQTLDTVNNRITLVLDHASQYAIVGTDAFRSRIPLILRPE